MRACSRAVLPSPAPPIFSLIFRKRIAESSFKQRFRSPLFSGQMSEDVAVNGELFRCRLIITLRCPAFLLRPDKSEETGACQLVDVVIKLRRIFV